MALGEPLEIAEISARIEPTARPRSDVRPHLHEALGLLLQANEYALELEQDVWDLAVELHVLRAAKLTNSDLRWLAAKGYIEHAVELTGVSDPKRHFRRTALLTFSDSTCVVLTSSGVSVAREACSVESVGVPANSRVSLCNVGISDDLPSCPKWDDQRRQLRVGSEIVKEFKLASPNQETILTAFEEEGWPPRIDDPLPQLPPLDPRRRLHDTIKALNRKQRNCLIRFMGDGSGEGIRWEFSRLKSCDDSSPTTCDEGA
jgi:hypothetical protein